MEKFFKLKNNNTTIRTEVLAGFTTFFTMAYIIFVEPQYLSVTGMDFNAVMVATCLCSVVGTLLIGLLSNLPFAQAPGMGLNAFFAFTICGTLAWKWEGALAAVFISGIIFVIITATGTRNKILNGIPLALRYAITPGIGLFIAAIGLRQGGVINFGAGIPMLDYFQNPMMILSVIGIVITIILVCIKVKGAILIGVALTTVIGMFIPNAEGSGMLTPIDQISFTPITIAGLSLFGLLVAFVIAWAVTNKKIFSAISIVLFIGTVGTLIAHLAMGEQTLNIAPTFMKMDFTAMFVGDSLFVQIVTMVTVVLSLLMIDMFDTMGTIVATADKAGIIKENGDIPNVNKAMMADAIATSAGAVLGTSTVTTYVESSAGVEVGGKTGLTSVVVAILFLLALTFAPIASIIPFAATTPALVIVGIMMMSSLKKINWGDFSQAAPAFVLVIAMPFTTSITDGIALGFLTYVVCMLASKKAKEITGVMWVLFGLFVFYYIMRASVIKG